MKITNEAQAQAARERLDLSKKRIEATLKLRELLGGWEGFTDDNIQAALSAYEAEQKMSIVLSEDARSLLRYYAMTWKELDTARTNLVDAGFTEKEQGFVSCLNGGREYCVLDAGRAYLALNKPRELKWEVHRRGVDKSFRGAFEFQVIAYEVSEYLAKINDAQYEVREVKP